MASWMKNTGMLLPSDVPVAFFGIDLHGETADVARQVGRAFVAGDRRKADEDRGFLLGPLKQIGFGDVSQ